MKNLEELIEKEKNKETKVLGPFLNKMKRDSGMISELEESTRYLDTEYDNVSTGQRFYHVWFNEHNIIKCRYCARNAKFSVYDRFSDKIDKKDSNYYTHCGSVSCLIDDFRERGNSKQGYGALIGKISGDTDTRNELLSLTSFLDEEYTNISDSQRFYHVFFNKTELELCEFCGKPRKYSSTNKFSEIYEHNKHNNYCRTCNSYECSNSAAGKYGKDGIYKKYGIRNQWDIPGYREGIEKTNTERHGAKYYTSTRQFKEKCTEKYNLDWEGKHPTSHQSTKDKKYKTNIGKYGFKCALQNPIIYDKHLKSCYSTKEYTMPSGKIIKVQGYEPWAIDKILENNYEVENNIITDKQEIIKILGDFQYNNANNTISYYFPDIYLKSTNKIIEVKSEYTYSINIEENIAKKESVIAKGLNFEFWIFDTFKNLLII
jgi:hypothetical protein